MMLSTRRRMIRARNSFPVHMLKLVAIAGLVWLMLNACGRVGIQLARVLL